MRILVCKRRSMTKRKQLPMSFGTHRNQMDRVEGSIALLDYNMPGMDG